ncbi:transporter [Ganoderma sinense ZZ0214-1]|uniref:Transporter n=1 Tax=Ganoderma sinense ZZ0214-1 TaxID=1077348 RepID=A0A2G8SCW6_9APHY|nr:transporter [Ganoderma sinense ZZ0214-1]
MVSRAWAAGLWNSVHQTVRTRRFWTVSLPYRTLQFANFACALHLFGDHIATISWVEGPSMVPTMAVAGEAALELKWINVNKLTRGDLVTFISPLDPGRIVCKRITGLPGDVVCVDPTGTYAPSTEHVVIPKNHIWVTGDNLAWSRDSRVYGPVPMGLLKGRLYARVWPVTQFGVFPNTFDYIS